MKQSGRTDLQLCARLKSGWFSVLEFSRGCGTSAVLGPLVFFFSGGHPDEVQGSLTPCVLVGGLEVGVSRED